MNTEILFKTINYFNNDVNLINHTIKVMGFAILIYEKENLSEKEKKIIELAAILHDVGINEAKKRFGSAEGKYQELIGPDIARKIMKDCNIDQDICNRVCQLIGNHHTYDKFNDLDFVILIESDFIVNIYESNIGKEDIVLFMNNYFKTTTGKKLIKKIYSINY